MNIVTDYVDIYIEQFLLIGNFSEEDEFFWHVNVISEDSTY